MSQEILELCQLQLHSIMDETNEAVTSVTASASECLDCLRTIEKNASTEDEAVNRMKQAMVNILKRLQFEDELSQRISHLMEILKLMEGSLFTEAQQGTVNKLEMANKIYSIFSIKSEFEQLEKIFPHLASCSTVDSIELF